MSYSTTDRIPATFRVWEGLGGAFLDDFDTKQEALNYIADNPVNLGPGDHYELGVATQGTDGWVEFDVEEIPV